MEYRITTPVSRKDLADLRAGDSVFLSGIVDTARDAAHQRMMECLKKGEPLPYPIDGSAVYYAGPTPARPGQIIGAIGPTTASRMDASSPALLDLGQKILIGKGRRDENVRKAIMRNGAVYLGALGGAGALAAQSIKSAEVLCWPDLGCEAVRKLLVEDWCLTVIIDSLGNDLYEIGPKNYRDSQEKLP